MKKITLKNQVLSFLVQLLPGKILLRRNKLRNWYDTNGIYKFVIGQKITLKARNIFGFGIRPEGIVKGYTDDGHYNIEMTKDNKGNFDKWMKENWVDPDSTKITQEEIHFKWNIEHHFKLAS